MITGEIKNQIDRIWDAFWSGGISNPLEVIEQITYLLFLRRLDDLHTLEENKSARLKKPIERRIFPEGQDARGRAYEDLRWSRFKHLAPAEMFTVVGEHVFPLRTLGGDESTYAHHMKDARFTIPTPALLAKVVDMIDQVPMEDRDTKGDLYEYMLGKIATAGQNGQFRTPRHVIQLMVEMTAPRPTDIMCDPASGTCGFAVATGEYLRQHHPEIFRDAKLREHFHHGLFHAFDFDNTMLRIGSMNMLLHGVENPDIRYRDSLAQDHAGEEEKYTLVLANAPFAGSLDYETCAKDLLQVVKTKKTELLFLALYLRLLKPRPRRRHRPRRRALRFVEGAQGNPPPADRGAEARCDRLAARRRVQTVRRRLDGDPAVHQDQLRRHRLRLVLSFALMMAASASDSCARSCLHAAASRLLSTTKCQLLGVGKPPMIEWRTFSGVAVVASVMRVRSARPRRVRQRRITSGHGNDHYLEGADHHSRQAAAQAGTEGRDEAGVR